MRLIAVLGPTGIGKTSVAARLAGALGGEVVVADSRQVYRRLEIATNKPLPEERALAPFHMIDLVEPWSAFNAHDFVVGATTVIEDVQRRGRLPILEGGTMLYVRALLEGFSLSQVPPDPDFRAGLAGVATEELARQVRDIDPDAGLDYLNRVRVVRALEQLRAAGPPLARLRTRRPPPWDVVKVGLAAPTAVIDRRLAERSRRQVERGLVEETRAALAAGTPPDAAVLTGTGYVEALAHLRGELSLAELPVRMAISNRQLARRQLTWLRREEGVRWFGAEPDPLPAILEYLEMELR